MTSHEYQIPLSTKMEWLRDRSVVPEEAADAAEGAALGGYSVWLLFRNGKWIAFARRTAKNGDEEFSFRVPATPWRPSNKSVCQRYWNLWISEGAVLAARPLEKQ
jgi:hypothetical protein